MKIDNIIAIIGGFWLLFKRIKDDIMSLKNSNKIK